MIFGDYYSQVITAAERKKCNLQQYNQYLVKSIGLTSDLLMDLLDSQVKKISKRANVEISYWEQAKNTIQSYTRQQAIDELITSKKINEKIYQISKWRLFND